MFIFEEFYMKNLFVLFIMFLFAFQFSFGQFGLGERLKRSLEEKIEKKAEEGIEKSIEQANEEEANAEDTKDNQNEQNDSENKRESVVPTQTKPQSMMAYSKFDFIPGDKIIFYEDFSPDAVGDFPSNWNTNGSGEVVTTNLHPGKWLKMTSNVLYVPDIIKVFPENFTVEFDLLFRFNETELYGNCGFMRFEIIQMEDISKGAKDDYIGAPGNLYDAIFDLGLDFLGSNRVFIKNYANGEESGADNDLYGNWIKGMHGIPIHISICINKQRYRLWINEKKVFDIPRLMDKDAKYNLIRFSPSGINTDYEYDVLLSNLKVAEGLVDTRSKLMTEGKFVTNAITFDSGSDKIKPESYSTIKSIADVLIANPEVNIMIIGHTDNDGTQSNNQILSEARANSVKKSLIKDFGLSESRIQTSGKGALIPITPNTSNEGKALNRRVEFIKL